MRLAIPNALKLEQTLKRTHVVPSQPPAKLFEYGTDARLVPVVDGCTLTVPGNRFVLEKLVKMTLTVPGLNVGVNFGATVTKCSPEEGVEMVGKAQFGSARMWLNMEPDKYGGTEVGYGIALRSLPGLQWTLPLITRFLESKTEWFADQYMENVLGAIALAEQV